MLSAHLTPKKSSTINVCTSILSVALLFWSFMALNNVSRTRMLHFRQSFVVCKVGGLHTLAQNACSQILGSGKSHTVATILENMLIPNFPAIGTLTKPLVGLVLHYGEGGANCLPSEAAWLSSSISSHVSGVPVRVYVSHSSLQTMKTVYSRFGDAKVTVEPLYFKNTELDAAAILSMMAVGSSESAPLYMQIILV